MLDLEPYGGELQGALDYAAEQGVGGFLCVCVDMENLPQVLDIARRYDNIHATVGVHPNHRDGHEPTVEELVTLAGESKVIGIGETGLDYFRSEGDLDRKSVV